MITGTPLLRASHYYNHLQGWTIIIKGTPLLRLPSGMDEIDIYNEVVVLSWIEKIIVWQFWDFNSEMSVLARQ